MHQEIIAFNQKLRSQKKLPELKIGDIIRVQRKIVEGDKERVQTFEGTIIAMRGGQSSSRTITVRKVSFGVGVELVLPLLSPQVEKITVVKHTRARRAKLYFIRKKSARVIGRKLKEVSGKEVVVPETGSEEVVTAEVTEATTEASEEKKVEA